MDENNSSIFPYLEGIEEWEFKWNELISIHSLGQVGYQGGGLDMIVLNVYTITRQALVFVILILGYIGACYDK